MATGNVSSDESEAEFDRKLAAWSASKSCRRRYVRVKRDRSLANEIDECMIKAIYISSSSSDAEVDDSVKVAPHRHLASTGTARCCKSVPVKKKLAKDRPCNVFSAKSTTTLQTRAEKLDAIKARWQDIFDDSLNDDEADRGVAINLSEARINADRFLHSLDGNSVTDPHSEAVPYLTDFNRRRILLVDHLYRLFNKHVFEDRLPHDMKINWNSRLSSAAGRCKFRTEDHRRVKTCSVELSVGLLKTADRVRDTLVHELCHAATFLLGEHYDVHGPFWRCWARRANIAFPSLPTIKRCHNYGTK